ncbi:TetR/AcrR family transcriptional regulator [Pseudonocardia sp. ICBG1293]|uniref:TetR/AcrR family transcriptional regulator n=1 Tax=Pseudonocardia sp. ICBG1293 TaxID=2844382 RepID=UPI001CCFAA7C|nr:TetR/AcrR family transcriptional regulator [Pseudonocardia sp. ICBG1293]
MAEPVPRVRRAEVRRRLLDAAAEVVAHRGYESAGLDEIARVAGFTKGAVYSNFSGKHALLAELIERHVRTRFSAAATTFRARSRPERALEDAAEVFARSVVEQDVWTRLLVEIAQQAARDPEVRAVYVEVRRALRDELTDVLAEAGADLGVEFTVPAEQVALTLQSLRLGLLLEHAIDPEQVDAAAVTAVFADTLRPLISTPDPARASSEREN